MKKSIILLFAITISFIGSSFANDHERRADAHVSARNFTDAIASYTLAIQDTPDDAMLYFKRAKAYLHSNQYDEYLVDMQEALRIDPELPGKLTKQEKLDDRPQ